MRRESGTARLEQAGRSLSPGAGGADARSGKFRSTGPVEPRRTSRCVHTLGARESGTGAARGGGGGLSCGLGGADARAASADGAATENNLGAGAPDPRGARGRAGRRALEEAVAAFHAALEERTTSELGPLDWGGELGNQGVALMLIADRTRNDPSVGEAAGRQIETAY